MSGIPTMASEAPADGLSLPSAEAWAIEHEAPLHSCPGCGSPTTGNDVCDDCSAVPCGLVGCINCDAETTEGFCATCDPGPMLAEIADARVSTEVVRLAVEAALKGEREEIAAMIGRLADASQARATNHYAAADDEYAEREVVRAIAYRRLAKKIRQRG